MKILFYMLILVLQASFANAQIDMHIEVGSPNTERQGTFVGSFDFKTLPEPLKPAKVNFTLKTVLNIYPQLQNQDWQIKLFYLDNVARVIGDTIFHWPGPHKPGDQFSGSFEFIPLMAGTWDISLKPIGFKEGGIFFRWCIDADGNLKNLSSGSSRGSYCTTVRTMFFTPDSVFINQFPNERGDWPFEYEITLKPTPRIGDICNVHFRLKANEDISGQCKITFSVQNMDVISRPENLNFSILKGQHLDFEFGIVPQAVSDLHKIGLAVSKNCCDLESKVSNHQNIVCIPVFSEDGSLRYINDRKMGGIRDKHLPKNFPKKIPTKKRNTVIEL